MWCTQHKLAIEPRRSDHVAKLHILQLYKKRIMRAHKYLYDTDIFFFILAAHSPSRIQQRIALYPLRVFKRNQLIIILI